MRHLLCVTLLIGLVVLQLHNLAWFPISRGYDAGGHAEYIQFLRDYHHLPLPNQGWELYQPPLYYFLAAFIPYRAINFFAWVLILGGIYHLTGLVAPKDRLLAVIVAAGLPVGLTLTPSLSNELLSSALIIFSLCHFSLTGYRTRRDRIFGAVSITLTVLTKATGFIAVAAILIELILQKRIRAGVVILAMVVAGSGWFYGRNLIRYGNPFISSVDFPAYAFSQEPGYRNVNFYINLSGFFTLDLFRAHWYSLLPGTYFSWYFDAHNVIIPIQSFSKIGILIVLLSLPITLSSLRSLPKMWHEFRILVVYTGMLWLAYGAYNLKLPFYSTVKSAFISSLMLPFAIGFAITYVKLPRKLQTLVCYTLVVLTVAIGYAFYIRPSWYG